MRRPRPVAPRLLAALVATAALTACGNDSKVASVEPTTTSAAAQTTTTAATGTTTDSDTTTPRGTATTVPAEGNDPMDYEGQLYDFGEITDVISQDGVVMIRFDREQLYADDGTLQSGKDFTSEPIVYGNTDVPYVNDSPAIRTFVLADDPQILRIADPIPCASDEFPAEPVWKPISTSELVDGAWRDRLMDSLTFDRNGLVARVRLSGAC